MDLERELDPLALSRRAQEAASYWRLWRQGPWDETDAALNPLDTQRVVSSRKTFQLLGDLPEHDPLRTPLRRWVYRLAEQRINHAALAYVGAQRYGVLRDVEVPEHGRYTLADLLQLALTKPDLARPWLSTFLKEARPAHEAVALLWQRRQEIAGRMGLSSPDDIELPSSDIYALAEDWLRSTHGPAEEFRRDHAADVVDLALARDATEGWPARLTLSSLLDWFRETQLFRDVRLEAPALPSALGGASFLCALGRVGQAWALSHSAPDQPFVVAHDPWALPEHRMGALLALLPADAGFAQRKMSVGQAHLKTQLRALSRTVLLESRALAMRVLLRRAVLLGARPFAEATVEQVETTFGCHVSPMAGGVLWQLGEEDAQRFAGLLLAVTHADTLTSAHDEDWYRNPRAVDQLRSEATLPPALHVESDALRAGAATLRAHLETALS